FGHETEKCKTNKQTEGNEGWTQLGKGKGKAPVFQPSPATEQCEGNVPTIAEDLNKEIQEVSQASSSTVPCEGNLTKEDEINKAAQESPPLETIKSLEKETQTITYEQLAAQSDSEEEVQELLLAIGFLLVGLFVVALCVQGSGFLKVSKCLLLSTVPLVLIGRTAAMVLFHLRFLSRQGLVLFDFAKFWEPWSA
ncbi:hypothetical protein U1Q18_004816, partial [Sarracenia purpurea var. burkii]